MPAPALAAPRAPTIRGAPTADKAPASARPRSDTAILVGIAVTVAIVITGAAIYVPGVFGGKLTPRTFVTILREQSVGVSSVRVQFSGPSCWTAVTLSGFTIGEGLEFIVSATLSYLNQSSLPASCDVTTVASATSGFSIVASNTPISVPSGGAATLRLTLVAPSQAFHGPLQITATDAWPIVGSLALELSAVSNSTGLGASSWCGASAYLLADTIHAGDWGYRLDVASSSVSIGDVLLRVSGPNGSLDSSVAGFYIVNQQGEVAACASGGHGTMSERNEFTYPLSAAANSSSPLEAPDTIFIDMGSTDPAGQGFTLEALGVIPYTGETNPVPLP